MKCKHENMNHNSHIARFISMQLKMSRGLVTKTNVGNGGFQHIPITRHYLTEQYFLNFACSGSFLYHISFVHDCISFIHLEQLRLTSARIFMLFHFDAGA